MGSRRRLLTVSWARLAIGLILVVCTVGARLPSVLHDPLWQDEVGAERVIAKPTARAALSQVIARESTPPAFYLSAWAVDRVARRYASGPMLVRSLRMLPVALSATTTALTFVLAAELLPLWAAALAGVLASFASELVLHGSELRAYSLLALACAAFALALRRAAASPRAPRLTALAAVVALGSLTHYFFLLTVAAGALWLLGLRRSGVWRVAAAMAVGLAPLAAWSPYWLRQYHHSNFATSPRFTPGRVTDVVSTIFVPQPIAAALGGVARVAILVVVVATAAMLLRRGRQGQLVALLVLLPLVAAAAIAALGSRVFNARNLVEIAPFAAIAVSWACAVLPRPRTGQAAAVCLGALVVAGWVVGQARLGRTPYDRIAHKFVAQGYRRNEPVVWFGRFGGFLPVRWYLATDGAVRAPRPAIAGLRAAGGCEALAVVAEGPRGRRWLDRHRASVRAEDSLPSYGNVPQGKRHREDIIVARLRWRPGILDEAVASHALVLHRTGPLSPCSDGTSAPAGNRQPIAPAAGAGRPEGVVAFDIYLAGNYQIDVMSGAGGHRYQLTHRGAGGFEPAWSPDARHIAFVSDRDGNDDLFVMDAVGGGQRRLTHGREADGHPAWAPKGRAIAFDRQGHNGRSRIWVMNADGSGQRPLTPTREDDAHPAWSPDGRTIAFDTVRGGHAGVYLMNADGRSERRLTRGGDAFPAWSPDGRWLAFETTRDGDVAIYVVGTDGRGQRRLTRRRTNDNRPTWATDGRQIAFAHVSVPGVSDIFLANVDGSGERRLTRGLVQSDDPAWKPAPPP